MMWTCGYLLRPAYFVSYRIFNIWNTLQAFLMTDFCSYSLQVLLIHIWWLLLHSITQH